MKLIFHLKSVHFNGYSYSPSLFFYFMSKIHLAFAINLTEKDVIKNLNIK